MNKPFRMKCLLILLLCFIVGNVDGQQKADSLLRLLNSSALKDTTRVNILNELSKSFRNADYEKSLQYAGDAMELAEKIIYKRGNAASLTNIGLIWYSRHEYEKSKGFFDLSLEIFEEISDYIGLANSNSYIGDIYFRQQLFEKAIFQYNQSLILFNKANSNIGVIHCFNNIGHAYNIQEKYGKAMEYYLEALNYADKSGEEKEIANAYINVANVLNAQSDYKNAIQYLGKSLIFFEQTGDKYNMGVCYNNIAANYISQDSLLQSLKFLDKSLQIYIGLGDKKGQAACYLNMGIVSDKNKEYRKAIDYYQSALIINESLKDKYRITTCLANLTISYLKLNEYNAVIDLSERGLKIARELNAFSIQRIYYDNLAATYDSLKNYKPAYENYKLLKQVDDSIFSAEKRKQVLELEAKYQSEKKEIQISNLTKDIKLQAIQLEKRRNLQWFLVVVSVLVFILSLVFYRLYALKLNSARILALKNQELEILNHTLSDSEAALKELNATKDKFFTIIAHDIKNPLSSYRSITKMLANSFFELSEQQKLEYIRGINKSSENLYNLFQNLLQWSTSQSGSMQFKPQEIDLGIIAYKAATILQESADKKNIEVEMNIKTDTYAFGDINMVSIVFVNLLSNAIKYTKPGGSIHISATDFGDYIKMTVTDNGIGIAKEDIGKLFRVEIDHKTIGDSEEKGTGIGLILCKEFVTRNGGEIWVESEYGKGSVFNFTLPKDLEKDI
jgi:signal transduction histidine kinase